MDLTRKTRERDQIRRVFSHPEQTASTQVDLEFIAEKMEELKLLDKEIQQEMLTSEDFDVLKFEEEYDLCDVYRKKWLVLKSKLREKPKPKEEEPCKEENMKKSHNLLLPRMEIHDEDRLREDLKDFIDDDSSEESGSNGEESNASDGLKKRKKNEDELCDCLDNEDYDLMEENLGVKIARNKFKCLNIENDVSDNEGKDDADKREVIAEKLVVEGCYREDKHQSEAAPQREVQYDDDQYELESDADDFIVNDDGRPIGEKKEKCKAIIANASLQEGEDIFGVEFDYEEFKKYEDKDEEDLDEYLSDEKEGGETRRTTKKDKGRRPTKKSIFEIYEPFELKRIKFTDLDNEIRKTVVSERMQINEVPLTPVIEGSNKRENEAEFIYKNDGKWCQLKQRKENLIKLLVKTREFQLDKVMENMRLIKDEDIDRLKNVQTSEELRDVNTHFLLYYSNDLPEMQKLQRPKLRKELRKE